MAVEHSPRLVGSKRFTFVALVICSFLIAGLVGWNLVSAPRLTGPTAGRSGPAPDEPRTSYNLAPPVGPTQTPGPASTGAASGPTLAKTTPTLPPGQAVVVGPGSNSPASSAPASTPAPAQYYNLLAGQLPTPTPVAPRPLANMSTQQLGPNVSYNNSLSQVDLTGPAQGRVTVRGAELVDANGARYFVAGVNYEGHTDRAWLMWQNDKFDPGLIGQNFATAAAGGYNSVRIFVQTQLRDDIRANNWSKLDKVAELAGQNGLRLLITFGDYYENNLSKLAEIDLSVARHFAGSSAILGYDLRNEPQLAELASLIYPGDQPPPLQSEDLIRAYGERMSQADSDGWRNGAGHNQVPGHLNSRQAYIYANVLKLYDEFQNDTGNWVNRNGRATAFDFYNHPDAAKWKPFQEAINGTVQRYIDVRQGAIGLADPGRPTTIGWNRPELAWANANRALGFLSFHRFPGDGAGGLAETLAMLDYLKHYYSGKPVVMEEFGYSNWNGRSEVPQVQTASYETAVWLFLYGRGYAGGFKWMLNNFSIGANPYENNFGLLDNNTQPKLAYYSAQAVLKLAAANRTPSGDFARLESYDGVTISYSWGSNNAFFGNARELKDSRVQLYQADTAPWAVWWPNNGLGQVYISTTGAAQVTLDLRAIFPSWRSGMRPTVSLENGQAISFDQRGDSVVAFTVQPGALSLVKAPVQPAAFNRAAPLGVSNNLYFKETGHNLSNTFKRYWEGKGGLALYGFPISEEFQENGFTVQYFERARFEYHPENSGTSNEVQLGLLGNLIAAGRREAGEAPFQPIAPFNNSANDVYFSQTGHGLRGGFKAFWEANGGLAQFGYPISEEFQEQNAVDGKVYTVQYFERNRFEWHPEFAKTQAEFQLGLLGLQIVKARGWLV